ncbi:MAG: hypothetical protein ACP5G2_07250 [Candidatus Bipolaricaulaceae bacterium]
MRVWLVVAALMWCSLPGWGLQISQIEFRLAPIPGEETQFSFQVRNDGGSAQRVAVYLGDWTRDETGANRFHPPGTVDRSLTGWLSVTPASFTLAPGENRQVDCTLTLPPPDQVRLAGTYWGMVFVQGEPRPVEREGTTVLAVERFGVKVYATVGGGERAGEIRGIRVRGLNPMWLEVKFVNTGTVNLPQVDGWAEVIDAQGASVARVELDPFPVLPGAQRWVRLDTDFRPPAGTYSVMVVVDVGGEVLIGGQTRLQVSPLALAPLPGAAGVPQDLDGDGFYEDVDGSGTLDSQDVLAFVQSFDLPRVQASWRAFDFDNDGDVDWEDVFSLEELAAP